MATTTKRQLELAERHLVELENLHRRIEEHYLRGAVTVNATCPTCSLEFRTDSDDDEDWDERGGASAYAA